ncbi:MAG: cellulase family glycosylhydrolase [Janthinobacterium lividum]
MRRVNTFNTRNLQPIVAALAATLLLAGCRQDLTPPAPPAPPVASGMSAVTAVDSTQQVVGIAGNRFTLNGNPWLPQGVMLRGFVGPPAYEKNSAKNAYTAYLNYGVAELNAAKAYGADMLRFQVSQPGLDPQSKLYDAQYVQTFLTAVKLARQHHFVVIISMQDESRSGDPVRHALPIAATVRNWDMLNGVFSTDRGVMFELYNEPALLSNAANWQLWAQGNPNATPDAFTGMQTLITRLRAAGSQNVLLLDGLGFASNTLKGVPAITDPLSRVAYAVHPYQHGSADESRWDEQFGIPSQTLPVLSTEWSAQVGNGLGLGKLPSYQVAVDLLNYMRAHNIPMGVGEFDIPGFMVQNEPGWTPTNYGHYASADTLQDAGMLVHNDFLNHYSRNLTLSDGL